MASFGLGDFLDKNPSNVVLLFSVLLVLAYFFFFPPFYASIDEHEYLKNAVLLVSGNIKNADPLLYCGGEWRGENYISSYAAGKSLLLVPFLPLGFPALLISGLLIHLLSTLIFFQILRRRKVDGRWSLLFLFYPAFIYESRTLFAEIFALFGLLVGLYFYLDERPHGKSKALAGLFFALTCFVRVESIVVVAAFGIALLWDALKEWRYAPASFFRSLARQPVLQYAVGALVGLAFFAGWNMVLYGGLLTTGYGSPSDVVNTIPQAFIPNLIYWVGILLLAYPLLLILPLKDKRLALPLGLSALAYLLLFSRTGSISAFPFFAPVTFAARMRYLIPLAGLLLVGYVSVLDSWLQRHRIRFPPRMVSRLFWVMGILLLLLTLVAIPLHQNLLNTRAGVWREVQSFIPANSLIIGSSDDCIFVQNNVKGFTSYSYASVASKRPPIEEIIHSYPGEIFVVALKYNSSSDSSIRQAVVDRERKLMSDFIAENQSRLQEVVRFQVPADMIIYRYAP